MQRSTQQRRARPGGGGSPVVGRSPTQAMASASAAVTQLTAWQEVAGRSPASRAGAALQRMADDQAPLQAAGGLEEEELLQGRFSGPPLQRQLPAKAQGGLPAPLRAGLQQLSGTALDDVRVHYGSQRPAEVGALAYAQGQDIHLGPGQEQHLPHEAWHAVQQRQGRVPVTGNVAGLPLNDDPGLEQEADVMGRRALEIGGHRR